MFIQDFSLEVSLILFNSLIGLLIIQQNDHFKKQHPRSQVAQIVSSYNRTIIVCWILSNSQHFQTRSKRPIRKTGHFFISSIPNILIPLIDF